MAIPNEEHLAAQSDMLAMIEESYQQCLRELSNVSGLGTDRQTQDAINRHRVNVRNANSYYFGKVPEWARR